MTALDPVAIWQALPPRKRDELGPLAIMLAMRCHLPMPVLTLAADPVSQGPVSKGSGRRLSAEQVARLRELAREGKTIHQIATAIGCQWGAVAHRVKTEGIAVAHVAPGLGEADQARIVELRRAGRSANEIAADVGCHPATVRRHLRAATVPGPQVESPKVPSPPDRAPDCAPERADEVASPALATPVAVARQAPSPQNKLSPDKRQLMAALRASGVAPVEIARQTECSVRAVYLHTRPPAPAPVATPEPRAKSLLPPQSPPARAVEPPATRPRAAAPAATSNGMVSDARRQEELAAIEAHIAAKGVTRGEPKFLAPSDHVTVPDAAERLANLEIVPGYGGPMQQHMAEKRARAARAAVKS